jgi:hypothetical protein
MKPKELLFAHRYSEAVEAFLNHMVDHPQDNYYNGLGLAFICLKRFHEAISSFTHDNEIEAKRTKGSCPSVNWMGAALWLMGEKADAMQEWRRSVSGILDGVIHYGDAAGGAMQGLLLWYGAVTLKDTDEHEYALRYLRSLKSKKVYGSAVLWPRPIIMMVLREKSFEDVLKTGADSLKLSECIENGKNDLLKRRQLCQILFYSACLEREKGDEIACMEKMRACFQLENPILQPEWYLARGECKTT